MRAGGPLGYSFRFEITCSDANDAVSHRSSKVRDSSMDQRALKTCRMETKIGRLGFAACASETRAPGLAPSVVRHWSMPFAERRGRKLVAGQGAVV